MNLQIMAVKLQYLRKIKGVSRKELAALLGVSIHSVNHWESSYRPPNDKTKLKIANFYGVSVENLFYNEADFFPRVI